MDTKESRYKELEQNIKVVLAETYDLISCMATVSCLIKRSFTDLLHVGFYRLAGDELLIGPYQGSFGCTAIRAGRGVCGKCVKTKKTIIVPDVHKFDGHISCDSRSNSEIAIPVFDLYGKVVAVLDLDSENFSNFDDIDKKYLEAIVKLLTEKKILA